MRVIKIQVRNKIAFKCKYVLHRKFNIIYKLLVLMKDFIYLFNKYLFSKRVAILGIADTAMSNTESATLVELIYYFKICL